jgi:hypothetical protein
LLNYLNAEVKCIHHCFNFCVGVIQNEKKNCYEKANHNSNGTRSYDIKQCHQLYRTRTTSGEGMEWGVGGWVGAEKFKCNQAHVCDSVLAHWMNCNLRLCHT